MGNADSFITVKQKLAGKWQIPLFLLSMALLFSGFWLAVPHTPVKRLEDRVKDLNALVEGRAYIAAIQLARGLLDKGPAAAPSLEGHSTEPAEPGAGPLPASGPVDRPHAPVHLALARSLCLQAKRDNLTDPATGALAVEHFDMARTGGAELSAEDECLKARAHEWMGDYRLALNAYRDAITHSEAPMLEVRQQMLELMRHPLRMDVDSIAPDLDRFIPLLKERLDLLAWAVEFKTELWLAANRAAELPTFVDEHRATLAASDFADLLTFIDAWVSASTGQRDQAELMLRDLRNRVSPSSELSIRSGWLLGQLLSYDEGPARPQEAISFFRDALALRPRGRYETAIHLGMAEALFALERLDESVEHYHEARTGVYEVVPSVVINEDRLRASLLTAVEQLRALGRPADALPFTDELVELVQGPDSLPANLESEAERHRILEIQASVLWQAAELFAEVGGVQADDSLITKPWLRNRSPEPESPDARHHLVRAAQLYEELAKLTVFNPVRSTLASWRAAELFDEAGDLEKSAELLQAFVVRNPNSEFTPRALLRLGLTLQALQRYSDAVVTHQENLTRFPRTPGAMAALIPLAQCYMALGQDNYELAEKTLMGIVEDSTIFTPQASIYADALFMLGDLQSRSGQVERAIPTLEEVLARFPQDSRAARSTFLLADAYRRSGTAILEKLKEVLLAGERDQLRGELNRRLNRAAELFASLVRQREAPSESDGESVEPIAAITASELLDDLYLEHAQLYQADCLYYLQRYPEALELYERTAWIYKESPSALAAYVQIINCYLFLSQPGEAQAALARAMYLVDRIPEDRFGNDPMSGGREEWRQYFQWVEQTGLF